MAFKEQFNTRIPFDLKARIEKYRRTMGLHFYEVSEIALKEFLERNEPIAQERRDRWAAEARLRDELQKARAELWKLRFPPKVSVTTDEPEKKIA